MLCTSEFFGFREVIFGKHERRGSDAHKQQRRGKRDTQSPEVRSLEHHAPVRRITVTLNCGTSSRS